MLRWLLMLKNIEIERLNTTIANQADRNKLNNIKYEILEIEQNTKLIEYERKRDEWEWYKNQPCEPLQDIKTTKTVIRTYHYENDELEE